MWLARFGTCSKTDFLVLLFKTKSKYLQFTEAMRPLKRDILKEMKNCVRVNVTGGFTSDYEVQGPESLR